MRHFFHPLLEIAEHLQCFRLVGLMAGYWRQDTIIKFLIYQWNDDGKVVITCFSPFADMSSKQNNIVGWLNILFLRKINDYMSWPALQILSWLCKFCTFLRRVVLLSEMFKQTDLEETEKALLTKIYFNKGLRAKTFHLPSWVTPDISFVASSPSCGRESYTFVGKIVN